MLMQFCHPLACCKGRASAALFRMPKHSRRPPKSGLRRTHRRTRLVQHASIALCGLTVAILLTSWYPTQPASKPAFTSPRHNVDYELAGRWAQGAKPTYPLQEFDELPSDIALALTPRDASLLDGEVVPKEFPGPIVLQALILSIDPDLARFIAPALAGLSLLLIGEAALLSTGSIWAALFGVVTFLAMVPFVAVSIRPTATDLAGVLGIVGGLAATVWAYDASQRHRRLVSLLGGLVAGLLFGIAVAFRYTNASFVLLFGLAAVIALRKRLGLIGAIATGGGIVAALILVYHTWVYGDPLQTGYSLGQLLARETVNPARSWPFGFDGTVFLRQLRLYLLRPDSLWALVLGSAGVIAAIRWRVPSPVRWAALPSLLFTAATILYQGGRNTYGADSYVANASFGRYLLPVFALGALYAAVAWSTRRPGLRNLLALAVLAVLATSGVTLTQAVGGFRTAQTVRNLQATREVVLGATAPNELIITRANDKILWPQRSTLVASYLVRHSETVQLGTDRLYQQVPSVPRLLDVIETLCSLDKSTVLMNDGGWLSEAEVEHLRAYLESGGLGMSRVVPDRSDLLRVECP